MVSPPPTKTNR